MKNSLLRIYFEKMYVNGKIYVFFYKRTSSFKIIGICEDKKMMNFIESTQKKERRAILKYAYEECVIKNRVKPTTQEIIGEIKLRAVKLNKENKVLVLKDSTIVGVYQDQGVDFIQNLSVETKKEIVRTLYQYGYIDANTCAKIFNKLGAY